MFSNFKDTFINKPQYESKPPKAVIEAISEDLPDGFHYEYASEGFCRLEADGGFNIQSGRYELPEKAKYVLKENSTYQDVMAYCFNSQTPLVINPDNDGGYIINGEHFEAKDLVKAPMRELEFSFAKMVMMPAKIDLELRFNIEGNGCSMPLVVHRVPNESIDVQKFESDDSQPLEIIYYMDPKKITGPFTFTINLHINKAKTVKSMIDAYKIFNAFMDGKGSIEGNRLETKERRPQNIVPDEVIDFWERVYEVEKVFGVAFDVSVPLKVIDAIQLEALYRSLIENKPFKTYRKYNSISGNGEFKDVISEDGTQIYLEYEITETLDILGQTISCLGIMGIFGATVESSSLPPKNEEGPFTINLIETEGMKMYESKIYFTSEDEMKDFQGQKNHIDILAKAEEIKEPEAV